MEQRTDWDAHWRVAIKMMLRPIRNRIVWRMYRPLIEAIEPIEDFSVLELAIGEGYITCKIIERFGGHGMGVDKSPYSIMLSGEYIRKFDIEDRMNLLKADILTQGLNLPKKKYYLVHSEGLVEHYHNTEKKYLFALHRNLSKRYVIIFTPRPSPLYWGLRRIFTKLGIWLYPDENPMDVNEIIKFGKMVGMQPIKSTVHFWENGVLFEV